MREVLADTVLPEKFRWQAKVVGVLTGRLARDCVAAHRIETININPGVEGLRERVHIFSPQDLPQTGNGSEILPSLLKTARVFLTMSVMEGFGMAACEAAACGVPVWVSAVPRKTFCSFVTT